MKFDDDNNTLGTFLAQHGNVGAEPSLAAGTEIGGWCIAGFIGRGGSSEVYCVKNCATGVPAALKILHRTERQHLDRFAREVHFLETHAGMAVSPSVGSRVPRDRRPASPVIIDFGLLKEIWRFPFGNHFDMCWLAPPCGHAGRVTLPMRAQQPIASGRISVFHPCVLGFGNNQDNFQEQHCPADAP